MLLDVLIYRVAYRRQWLMDTVRFTGGEFKIKFSSVRTFFFKSIAVTPHVSWTPETGAPELNHCSLVFKSTAIENNYLGRFYHTSNDSRTRGGPSIHSTLLKTIFSVKKSIFLESSNGIYSIKPDIGKNVDKISFRTNIFTRVLIHRVSCRFEVSSFQCR